MAASTHPIAIANMQGIVAVKFGKVSPWECWWPLYEKEATQAWLAGYSLAALVASLPTKATMSKPQQSPTEKTTAQEPV